ncbi:AMP-dependent synthetase/ligase [Methyloversatilis sp.]|uniref:AMP-dependent synthetase/ligase n=1 Tax=Methyloversatilis sp. TaxID=2569862 RepID=UPI003F71D33C
MKTDTFPKLLLRHAQERGDRPALREKSRGIWQTLTWQQLADEVATLAAGLAAQGFQRGNHIGLLGENRPRLFAAMAAAQWLGGVVVPLFADTTAEEIAGPIRSADVAYVFAENQEQVDKLLSLLPQCPAIQHIFFDDDRGMRHYSQPQLLGYDVLLAQGREGLASREALLDAELARGCAQDPAVLFFTSGTTGPARGVLHSHGALIDRARAAAQLDGLGDTDVTLAYLPPAWIGQHVMAYAVPMVAGSCVCCPESSETMLHDMREMGPSIFLAPPRVLEALLTQITIRINDTGGIKHTLYSYFIGLAERVGERILARETVGFSDRMAYRLGNVLIYGPLRDVLGMSRLRVAYTAGEAVGPDLLRFYRSIGINLKQLYGSTETGLFVTMQRDDQVIPDAVGPAAPGVELAVSPEREVLVRSPGLFLGYHGDAEGTRRAMDADGWFHTGDAGWMGDDGQLHIIDRLKDVGTLADGSLFAPKLVENKLKFSAYINEVVAFGDGRDRVCAFIDIDPDAVGNWADRQGLSYTGFADLSTLDEVYMLIGDVIAEANAEMAAIPGQAQAQVHRFLLLHKRLEADDGELTRMRKVRRDVIAQRFGSLVTAFYDGSLSGRVDAEVRYEDGRVGIVSADVKIRDAKTFPPRTMDKAA